MSETQLPNDPTELVQKVIADGFNNGDEAIMRAAFADEVESRLGTVTLDEAVQKMTAELSAYEDSAFEIRELWRDDDTVFVHYTLAARLENKLPVGENVAIEPTGEEFEAPGLMFARVEDGAITAWYNYFDRLGGLQQMDAIPPLEELAS